MINVTNRKSGPYVGTGSNSSFPFDFKVFAPADVMVVIADETGQEHTAVITSEYTVTLNPDQDTAPGGYVVTTAPLAAGRKLGITSAVEAKQLVQLTNLGGFYPEVINAALDRLTILVQQLAEKMTRAIVVGLTSNVDTHGLVTDLVFETESTLFDAARDAARIATGASAWLSSTTYPSGAVVFGTNGHSYRAVTQNQNVNPVTDVSGTWAKLTIGLGTTAVDACRGDRGEAGYLHTLSPHASTSLDSLLGLIAAIDISSLDVFFKGDLYVKGADSVIGYGNGSGGTVTQSVSKSTSVTLNKGAGAVTMHAASLAGGGTVSFVLNSNLISAMDVVVVGIAHNSVGDSSFYNAWASADSAYNGGAVITLQNISGGALAENVVLNFAVIKGYQS